MNKKKKIVIRVWQLFTYKIIQYSDVGGLELICYCQFLWQFNTFYVIEYIDDFIFSVFFFFLNLS